MEKAEASETLRTSATIWEVGPYGGALPIPLRLLLNLDGEIIVDCEVETGFAHRGLEKAMGKQSWFSVLPYADHLDPEASVYGELVLCMAAEKIGKIEVPPRAQLIRLVLSELARVSSHMVFIVRMAHLVGADTIGQYVLRDRERVLDLFELLTGARFSLNFVRYGGVKLDITEGFVERVLEMCELVRVRIKEYNDLFTFNHAFLKRTSSVGVLGASYCEELGITGPNARAAGIKKDGRKAASYLGYDQFDFHVPVGAGETGLLGDCHDRFLVRLREISQSLGILKHACESVPSGNYSSIRVDRGFTLPAGEAFAEIESSRGLLRCHVVSDGGGGPKRIRFETPSEKSIRAIPSLLGGESLEDMPVIVSSLDLSISEVDR